jgi:hypothetical protein
LSASWDDTIAWYESTAAAEAGTDYTESSSTLTFNAGETAKTFTVTILDDDRYEADEVATFTLSDANGVSIAKATGTLTISDDDEGPDFGHTNAHVITKKAKGAQEVYAADLDGDGDLDVLSAYDHTIAWYENKGGAASELFSGTPHVITKEALLARAVHAADLDGDGDLDVLSASWSDNKIAWYENGFK